MVSRKGIGLAGLVVDLIVLTDGIGLEVGMLVNISIEGDRRQSGRLNALRFRVDQDDQSQNVRNPPIRLSAICMSPVELPYVPILSNETFTKALWDTVAEKPFISGRSMTLHSPTENSLAVLNHKISEANSPVQNVKLGGHQTCLSINRLGHELCDMLHRLVGTTAPGHHDCSIKE
ncbi:uncharacterized protein TNCV_3592351 [Trichonephila clavipes]|nr:uncharacterized protein TNCV_3592351 [Trichonephila clavipes]